MACSVRPRKLPAVTGPVEHTRENYRAIMLSVLLLEGGMFLVVAAWLWSSAQFPTWAQPVMLHPACRAFVSALGVLDIWAACDWLAERMLDPERK